MIRSYRGYALPSSRQVAYALEYLCPRCKSEDVELDESIDRPIFYDGSPSTEDTLSAWKCKVCGYQNTGDKFVARSIEQDDRL